MRNSIAARAMDTSAWVQSQKSRQWKCIVCNLVLTFILSFLGTLIFVEITQFNPISILFSISETPNPTIVPTTTVKPIEWDPCVNETGDEQSKFYIGNTQYFVETNLNLVLSIVIIKGWITCESLILFREIRRGMLIINTV